MVALVLGGCAVDKIERVSVSSGEVDDCDPLVCSGNSDLLGLLKPYELDETGVQYSARGWRITDVKLGQPVTSGPLAVQVLGTSLRVTYPGGSVTGAGLAGSQLTLEHTDGKSIDLTVQFKITGGPTNVTYYVTDDGDGLPDSFEGFHVSYDTGIGPRELCPYAKYDDHGVTGDWAVFWKGDRYDPATGKIFASDGAVDSWFNISCAGEATIKMLRARTGGAVAPGSPVDQRQATLNMFTASYCGPNGQRYTKLGQALTWSDLSGPSQIGPISSYEAVWTSKGARCLDTPRLVDLGEIKCEIESCPRVMIDDWQDHGWLLSGNPKP
jgi:hypothetical protein